MSMEKLKLIQDEWAKDSVIDQMHIDDEVAKTPRLHQKYLDFLTTLKVLVFKRQAEFLELKGARSRYYNGSMTKEELGKYGWDQYQGKMPLKSELERLLEVDPVLLKAEERLFELKASFEYVEEVMKSLRYRNQDLRVLVDWKKFLAGN
ncbi:MAG TPA: recombination mediator protein UvsY [Methanosarcina sp.]|nr:recombination mediator protein UvsY [Methanosarcina sp.]